MNRKTLRKLCNLKEEKEHLVFLLTTVRTFITDDEIFKRIAEIDVEIEASNIYSSLANKH